MPRQVLRLTPRGIGDHLGLLQPIYARTAAYGHFGRPPESLARHFGATVAAA